jgi:hypothetical protein
MANSTTQLGSDMGTESKRDRLRHITAHAIRFARLSRAYSKLAGAEYRGDMRERSPKLDAIWTKRRRAEMDLLRAVNDLATN